MRDSSGAGGFGRWCGYGASTDGPTSRQGEQYKNGVNASVACSRGGKGLIEEGKKRWGIP